MPKILIRLIVIAMLLITSQACENEVQRPQVMVCPFETDGIYHENSKSEEYQALIDGYVKRGIPGVALLVKNNSGFFVGASGMADIKNGIPMQPVTFPKLPV